MKLNLNIKRNFAILVAIILSVLLQGQTQYDYYDDEVIYGGADRALNGIIIIGGIIVVLVILIFLLGGLAKIYHWFNPEANPDYKRAMAAKEKERETIRKGENPKASRIFSEITDEAKQIPYDKESIKSEKVRSIVPPPKLTDDEIDNIRNNINPTEEETKGSRFDLDCKYGNACYTKDYKKFIRLSFSYCYIVEGTKATLKVLDGTEIICSNAINSKNQEQVILPDSLLYIGDNAINCESMKEIILPQSLRYIGDSALWGCKNLQKITIPNGVCHIGTAAFSNTGINEIVSNSPEYLIDNYCLFDKSRRRMIKYFGSEDKVIIPPNVNDITGAFAGCKVIEQITLPQGLTSIGERTFMNCSRLKTIVIQEGVREIGRCAFMNCQCLEYIVIPEGVKTIREFCFDCCQNLRYIVLPSTLEQIGSVNLEYSDYGIFNEKCISLNHIFIPKGTKKKFVKFFSEEILMESSPEEFFAKNKENKTSTSPDEDLKTTITEQEIKEGWSDEQGVRYSADGKKLLYSTRRTGNYIYSSGVKDYTVKDGTVVICDNAFESGALASITLPDSIKKIGNSAFSGCKSLKQINIPSGVVYLGEYVFNGCSAIEHVDIPSSLQIIRKFSFNDCSSLKDIILPYAVKEIHDSAFYNCCHLKELALPEGLEYIGNNAFGNCSRIQEITIPSSVIEIAGNPFGGEHNTVICKSSEYVVYKGGLYTSDKITFLSCLSNETTFDVVEGVKVVSNGAFYYNRHLQKINLPSSLVEIGDNTFWGCDFVKIQLPDSLKRIGNFAFGNCEQLSIIVLPNRLEYLGENAFWSCKRIYELVLPKALRKIEKETFGCCSSLKCISILNPEIVIDENAFDFLDTLERIEFNGCPPNINETIFNQLYNLKEITVPRGTKKKFCDLLPSKKDIIKIKVKNVSDNTSTLELSTTVNDSDKNDFWKDDSDVIYSKDRKKLLLCAYKESVNDPIEDEFGNKMVVLNNRLVDYDDIDAFMDRMDSQFYYEVSPGTEVICDKAFSHCENLAEIIIPESVKAIGIRAFEDCKSMKRFDFPSNVGIINEYCFIACRDLMSVTFPESLRIIEKCAFVGCKNLKKLEFPNSLKIIGESAFRGCPLEEIVLPNCLEEVGPFAFGYTKINELIVPASVKRVGRKAFADCNKLKKVIFKGEIIECDSSVFSTVINEYGEYRKMPLDVILVPKGTRMAYISKFPEYKEIIAEEY